MYANKSYLTDDDPSLLWHYWHPLYSK